MLYTLTGSDLQRDRIHLFPSPEAARHTAREPRAVQVVAVRFDLRLRRLSPLWTDSDGIDPTWTTPAELQPDGSVVARGPIPDVLFVPDSLC